MVEEQIQKRKISLEFLVGLIAIALGTYNLLLIFNIIDFNVILPQTTANVILIIVGIFLWITAFRLARHKYHSRSLF